MARRPAGREFHGATRARNGDNTAPFAAESQSFLDHLVAGFSPNGSWSDRRQAQCQGLVLRRARIRHIAVRILYALSAKRRHFRGLAEKGLVSHEKSRPSCAKGRESRVESLLIDFSISEIWERERPEAGCVSAETDARQNRKVAGAIAHGARQLPDSLSTLRDRIEIAHVASSREIGKGFWTPFNVISNMIRHRRDVPWALPHMPVACKLQGQDRSAPRYHRAGNHTRCSRNVSAFSVFRPLRSAGSNRKHEAIVLPARPAPQPVSQSTKVSGPPAGPCRRSPMSRVGCRSPDPAGRGLLSPRRYHQNPGRVGLTLAPLCRCHPEQRPVPRG
jgi:hypothetical protein